MEEVCVSGSYVLLGCCCVLLWLLPRDGPNACLADYKVLFLKYLHFLQSTYVFVVMP